jgi:hypothetical protein
MNPDKVIRSWLLICGKQIGINDVYNTRWPDAETRPQVPFCTYHVFKANQEREECLDLSSKDEENGLTKSASQLWSFEVEISIHNRIDGLNDLARFVVGAQSQPVIQQLFYEHGVSQFEIGEIIDETEYDMDYPYNYAHTLRCKFYENVEFSLYYPDEIVDTINVSFTIDGV